MTIVLPWLTRLLPGALALTAALAVDVQPGAAQPAAADCGSPCAWVRSYGTGEGSPRRPDADTDMRFFGFATPHADGGATLIGEAITEEGRRLWLAGLDAGGDTVWESFATPQLCQGAGDGSGRSVVMTRDPDSQQYAVAAYGTDGEALWMLPLAGEPSAVGALPGGGAVVAQGRGNAVEVIRIASPDGFVFDRSPAIDSRWTVSVPQVSDALPAAVAALPDGGLILAGYDLDRQGGGFVLRLDGDGAVTWDTRFAEVGRPTHRPCGTGGSAAMVEPLADGRSAVLFLSTRPDGLGGLVVGLDGAGQEAWRHDPALDDADRHTRSIAMAIGRTTGGGLLVSGMTSRPRGEFAHWVTQLTPDGMVDWRQDITQPDRGPGSPDLSPTAVAGMPDGGVLALATSGARRFQMRAWAIRLGADGVDADGTAAVHPPAPTNGPEDLLGMWIATNLQGAVAHLRFAPDGRMVVLAGGREQAGRYTVDFRPVPARIDFTIDGDSHLGILEILPDGSARMAFDERDRPTSFEPGRWEVVTLARPSAPDDRSLDEAGSRDAVMRLLGLVPDTRAGRAGRPLASYADYEAIVEAAYARTMPDMDIATVGFETMAPALIRVSAGPGEYVQYLRLTEQALPDLLGIAVTDVRRGLAFGSPPEKGLLLGLAPGDFSAAVAAALDARGFARRDIAGTTVWHRLEDGRMDLQSRDPADPFFGQLGQAARIALMDGVLGGSPFWSVAEGMAAAAADGPSLGDDRVARAAVDAVTDADRFDGRLLQLMLIDPVDVMVVDTTTERLLEAVQEGRLDDLDTLVPDARSLGLPPYLMAVLADRFAGDRDEAVVALVYPDAAMAEAAAAALASRLEAFRPDGPADAWADLWADPATTRASHVYADGSGLAVAVVTIGVPAVFPTDGTDGGLRPVGGRVFRMLASSYYRRGLVPLAVLD